MKTRQTPPATAARCNEILAARRWDAERRQAHTLALLHEQHPEVEVGRRALNGLYAKRGMALIFEPDTLADIDAQISAGRERLQALMAAAGITEADLAPPYICPACMDRGVANSRTCVCKQAILNQLVYEQLCDVSPAREYSFANFSLTYYDREQRAAMGRVVESCLRYVREFSRESKNLLFTGAPGLGKTHLSLAVAEGVVRSGRLAMYVSAPHLMDELERGKFQKDAAALEYREIIFGCDLLVIR